MSFPYPVQVIFGNIVANFASTWQEEGGKKMSFGETASLLLASAKKVFCLQTIAVAAFPCLSLPFFASPEESISPGQQDGPMGNEDRSWWTWWWWWSSQPSSPSSVVSNMENEIAGKEERQVRRVTFAIIFLAKLVSSLLASIICYAIFSHTQGSSLDMALSHR